MSIGIINKVNVNSVSSESKDRHSLSVFCGLDIMNSVPVAISDFSKVRIRLVVSYSKHSNQVMDFVSQRFNEFKNLQKTNKQFGTSITTPDYVSYLRDDLNSKNLGDPCENSYRFLEESSPFSPFSTKPSLVTNIFKKQFVYGDGENTPAATAMYDSPVEFLMSPESVKKIKNGMKPNAKQSEIQLDPVQFSFADTDFDKINDLSVYAYVYTLMEGSRGISKISLSTGMTEVSSATLKGQKTTWDAITPIDPFIGIGFPNGENEFPNTTTQFAPDTSKFLSLNIMAGLSVIGSSLSKVEENLSQRGSGFSYRESGYKIIKDSLEENNFFSNLWMTKDSNENRRFTFGFDLGSYLAANSLFPYLYKNPQTAIQLLDGVGDMESEPPSRVMNISVSRFFIEPHSNLPINELGTNGYSTLLGPNGDFTQKIIRDVKRTHIIIPKLEGSLGRTVAKNKIQIYEAKDILDTIIDPNNYSDGSFRYRVNYTVYDASITFLRKLLSSLLRQQNIISDVYDYIVRNSIYNTETGYLFSSPGKVSIYSRHLGIEETLDFYLSNALDDYDYVMSSLLQSSPSLVYFSQRFQSDNLEIKYIREFLEQIKVFTHLITRKISEVAPNDPMGRRPDLSKAIEFKSKGLMEVRMPVMRGNHFFDHKEVVGKNYGFGLDYMFVHEGDEGDHNGLSHLSLEEYDLRLGQEISKHFHVGQPGNISSPSDAAQNIAPLLGESSFRYFTPYIIRTPNTDNKIFQNIPDTVGESVYPIDRYAKMFVDVFKQRNSVESGGLKDPLSMNHIRNLSPNGTLYESVTSVLDMYHSCEFSDSPEIEYPPLQVIRGKKDSTTNFENLFRFDPISFSSGPLAIPSIVGGNNNLGTAVESYFSGVDNSVVSQYNSEGVGYEDQKNENLKELERPIKLPFAIFGELSIDKDIVLSIIEQDKIFNSIKKLTSDLGYSEGNLEQIFNDALGVVPNSMKSLFLIAATNERQSLLNASLDTNRPILEDKNPDQESQSIAVNIFGEGDQLEHTGDPMKIYAKFMAFWMNYKQVSIVEYLGGFESLKDDGPYVSNQDSTRLNKLALPEWAPLDSFTVQNILKTRKKILCRVRNYTLADYLSRAFPQLKKSPFIDYRQDVYDFPVYNKYFYLGYEEPVFAEGEEPMPFLTTENECHQHSYYVDEKGNGWTSMAVSPDNSNIMHRHQIINFEVQSAQSDCYPHCETKYGTKGVGPHEHKLTNNPKQLSEVSSGTPQETTVMTSLLDNGNNNGY